MQRNGDGKTIGGKRHPALILQELFCTRSSGAKARNDADTLVPKFVSMHALAMIGLIL